MNKTKIEWTDYTWNPVIGCNRGCSYCYARRWAKRSGQSFEPHLSKTQQRKPYKIKESSKIFVCSLADLFGEWVPRIWIDAVLYTVKENPHHTFQFLTKNPERYWEFTFPENCWLGVTIDYPDQDKIDTLSVQPHYKFISFEPILGDMSGLNLYGIDLCIIGRDTSPGAKPPKREWIDSVKHENIFLKGNLRGASHE